MRFRIENEVKVDFSLVGLMLRWSFSLILNVELRSGMPSGHAQTSALLATIFTCDSVIQPVKLGHSLSFFLRPMYDDFHVPHWWYMMVRGYVLELQPQTDFDAWLNFTYLGRGSKVNSVTWSWYAQISRLQTMGLSLLLFMDETSAFSQCEAVEVKQWTCWRICRRHYQYWESSNLQS